jgi:guanine nucleotide-binding protein subunit alpha
VIQLNLVRNVNTILDILAREILGPTSTDDDLEITETHGIRAVSNNFPVQLSEKYDRLNLRLSPLRKVQKDLETRLGAASSEETSTGGVYDPSLGLTALAGRRERAIQEFSINSTNGWKSALNRVLPVNSPEYGSKGHGLPNGPVRDSTTEIIASCRGDMMALWADPMVHDILNRSPPRIQDEPGL